MGSQRQQGGGYQTYNHRYNDHPGFRWSDSSATEGAQPQVNNQRAANSYQRPPPGYNNQQRIPPPRRFITEERFDQFTQAVEQRFIKMEKEQKENTNTLLEAMQQQTKLIMKQQEGENKREPGKLPSKSEVNPREQCNAITLRSGTAYKPPPMPPQEDESSDDETVKNSEPQAPTVPLQSPTVDLPSPPVQPQAPPVKAVEKETAEQKKKNSNKAMFQFPFLKG